MKISLIIAAVKQIIREIVKSVRLRFVFNGALSTYSKILSLTDNFQWIGLVMEVDTSFFKL